jgi:CRISPR/Cas system-associated exonuclease Cas4 (RecB family)
MSLYHQNLGLSGKADMVEWRNNIPIPVETKTGKFRTFPNYEIQVCLQALCLEDMFWCTVPYGEIFFTGSMRRKKIILDSGIREKSSEIVLSLRNAFLSYDIRRFQRANDVRCHACMYNESCLPEISQ